jgi:SNF2 family DNA or RNA helicase
MDSPPLLTQLWRHQRDAFSFALGREASMLAMEPGTGKSLSALALAQAWGSESILVVCPKSVLSVWRREFAKWDLPHELLILDRGVSSTKARRLEKFWARALEHQAVIINYDSVWRAKLGELIPRKQQDLLIFDESHRVKSSRARVSRFCWQLRADRQLLLTGTPMSTPLDLWSQFRLISPTIFAPYFTRFRARYAITKQVPTVPVPIVTGYQNQDELQEIFRQHAFSCSKDVLELPEETHQQIDCILPEKTMRFYRELDRDFYAELEGGRLAVPNALIKLLRMQQITSGCLPLECDDNQEQMRVIDTVKADMLKDLISDFPPHEQVVVFCRFRSDLDATACVARALKRPYGEISGAANDLTSHGTLPDEPGRITGAQLRAGGVGVDLQRAHLAVFYSLGFSLTEYEQAVARVHRAGQTESCHFYHLVAPNTVDEKVYRALRDRKEVVRYIMERSDG